MSFSHDAAKSFYHKCATNDPSFADAFIKLGVQDNNSKHVCTNKPIRRNFKKLSQRFWNLVTLSTPSVVNGSHTVLACYY